VVLLIGSLAVGNFAVLRGQEQGWAAPSTIAQLAAALIGLIGFVLLERRVPAPTLDPRMFGRPAFAGAASAVFMSRVLTIGAAVYVVQYAQGSLQLSATETGLLLTPAFVAQIVAGQLGGRLLAGTPPGRVIASGYACKLVGALGLGLAITPGGSAWALVVPLLIWGVGGGLAGAPVMAVAMNAAGPERAGMAAGAVVSLASIGAGIGAAVLGAVYQARLARAEDASTAEAAVAAGRAVMFCSAGLAAVSIVIVLALVNSRTTTDGGRSVPAGG
jgi:predicted MFS family arabinose efflux permease